MTVPLLEPTTESRLKRVERFFSRTAGSYDFIVDATTLGADRRWKALRGRHSDSIVVEELSAHGATLVSAHA